MFLYNKFDKINKISNKLWVIVKICPIKIHKKIINFSNF